jgi:hypothetical protein
MTFDPNGLLTSWPSRHGQVFLQPETLIVPLYHKIRISAVSLIDRIQEIDGILELFRAHGLVMLKERITWDLHLCTLNAFRTELAGSTVDDRNKRRLLLRDYPRFLWRIEAAVAGSPVFEALLDATDLLQGQHMVDVVPYDKAACLAIGSTRASIANYPHVVRFFDWPHFRGFDLNNIDYQWLAGHSAF